MEGNGGGILGRLGEKILSWIALALVAALAFALYKIGAPGRRALFEGIWRSIVWLAAVGLLPWSARFFIRRIVEIGSNWVGFILIAALIVVDAVVGLVLLKGLPSGGWGWLAALTALAVAGAYNFLVAEYLTEQAGG
jgi:hypothetical protein